SGQHDSALGTIIDTVFGTITTDGTTGTLSPGNVVAWQIFYENFPVNSPQFAETSELADSSDPGSEVQCGTQGCGVADLTHLTTTDFHFIEIRPQEGCTITFDVHINGSGVTWDPIKEVGPMCLPLAGGFILSNTVVTFVPPPVVCASTDFDAGGKSDIL